MSEATYTTYSPDAMSEKDGRTTYAFTPREDWNPKDAMVKITVQLSPENKQRKLGTQIDSDAQPVPPPYVPYDGPTTDRLLYISGEPVFCVVPASWTDDFCIRHIGSRLRESAERDAK
jgi:hypothetical protein